MMPNEMMPPTATPKKRRPRKPKPVVVDPEAEAQERELRRKIKQSLAAQQTLRTEVEEEDKAQQHSLNVQNVVRNDMAGEGMMADMSTVQRQMLMSQMEMAMGYGGMGGMGMPQALPEQYQSPQEQYQHTTQGQAFDYRHQGEIPGGMGADGMGGTANISTVQQQMQQMQLQLELQRMQLEQQLLYKRQLQMQEQHQQVAYGQNGGGANLNSGSDLDGSGHTPLPHSSAGSSPSPHHLPTQSSVYPGGPTQPSSTAVDLTQDTSSNQAVHQQQYQSQSYASPQLGPTTPQIHQAVNGHYGQPLVRLDTQNTQKSSNATATQREGLKSSQEMNKKSLFSLSSNADSWLKAGSMNTSTLNNSMAFHSVGGMTASFGSEMGGTSGGLDSSRSSLEKSNVPNNVVVGDGEGVAAGQRGAGGDGADAKKAADERISKGPVYTETTVGLHPIQENEAADSPDNVGKMGQNSILMSMMETEAGPAGSASSLIFNELAMSMDSAAFNSLMQQSGGDINLSTLIASETAAKLEAEAIAMQKESSSSSEGMCKPAAAVQKAGGSPGDSSANGNGNKPGRPKLVRLRTKESSAGSSALSSEPGGKGDEHRMSKESKESSESQKRGGRRGSTLSKMSMMSEISQWTKNNPFDGMSVGESPSGAADGGAIKKQQPQPQKQNSLYDMNMRDSANCQVEMGDFHSVGGSIANSLDISMMSSMTGEVNIDGGLNESLRNLDLSNKSSGAHSGLTGDKSGGSAS
ncbi:hypothetical protein ACHAXT_010374 [Thalassiosira profunda]